MNKHERDRKFNASERKSATKIGNERLATPKRKCPVPDCKITPKYYSRYCEKHAVNLKRTGHPTVNLNIRSREDYASCLKVGRWVRHALTKDDSDRRAWMRIEAALTRIGKDHSLKHPIPVIYRRKGSWRNDFKALCVVSQRLEKVDAEEMITAYLGLASVILMENDILVNSAQLELMLNKAGGRAASRWGKWLAYDPDAGKSYRWRPSEGCYTQIGKVIAKEIAKEYGRRWYKAAEEVLVIGHHGPIRD